MSCVNLIDVQIPNNPCAYNAPYEFEITFEVVQEIKDDLEFKIVYVGSAESQQYDQVLESVLVGPVAVGTSKFTLSVPAQDPAKIPMKDTVGVTVVLLSCSYRDQEFVRVGYYVNNDYVDEELKEIQPEVPRYDQLQRTILADKPRVTRYNIAWDESESAKAAA